MSQENVTIIIENISTKQADAIVARIIGYIEGLVAATAPAKEVTGKAGSTSKGKSKKRVAGDR